MVGNGHLYFALYFLTSATYLNSMLCAFVAFVGKTSASCGETATPKCTTIIITPPPSSHLPRHLRKNRKKFIVSMRPGIEWGPALTKHTTQYTRTFWTAAALCIYYMHTLGGQLKYGRLNSIHLHDRYPYPCTLHIRNILHIFTHMRMCIENSIRCSSEPDWQETIII